MKAYTPLLGLLTLIVLSHDVGSTPITAELLSLPLDLIITFIETGTAAVDSLLSGVADGISTGTQSLTEVLTGVIDGLFGGITSGVESLIGSVNDIISSLGTTLGSLVDGLTAGLEAINPYVDTIISIIPDFTDILGSLDFTNLIPDFRTIITDFFAIKANIKFTFIDSLSNFFDFGNLLDSFDLGSLFDIQGIVDNLNELVAGLRPTIDPRIECLEQLQVILESINIVSLTSDSLLAVASFVSLIDDEFRNFPFDTLGPVVDASIIAGDSTALMNFLSGSRWFQSFTMSFTGVDYDRLLPDLMSGQLSDLFTKLPLIDFVALGSEINFAGVLNTQDLETALNDISLLTAASVFAADGQLIEILSSFAPLAPVLESLFSAPDRDFDAILRFFNDDLDINNFEIILNDYEAISDLISFRSDLGDGRIGSLFSTFIITDDLSNFITAALDAL